MTVVLASNLGGWAAVTVGCFFLIAVGAALLTTWHAWVGGRDARAARTERERAYAEDHPIQREDPSQ
jgi:hypothetical protein